MSNQPNNTSVEDVTSAISMYGICADRLSKALDTVLQIIDVVKDKKS